MIGQLSQLLSEEGQLLIGELVWIQQPSQYFLNFLEMKESDYFTESNLQLAMTNCNMEIKRNTSVSLEEYETKLLNNVEDWARDNPNDPDRDVILQKSRDWNTFSQEHAWSTWQFATIVAKKLK